MAQGSSGMGNIGGKGTAEVEREDRKPLVNCVSTSLMHGYIWYANSALVLQALPTPTSKRHQKSLITPFFTIVVVV